MKKTQRWLCMLLVFCMLLSVLPFTAAAEEPPASSADESMITISTTNYKMKIEKAGFRYSFEKPDGTPIIAAHETSGLRFGAAGSEPSDVVSTEYSGEVNGVHTFRVKNANNMEADVTVTPSGNHVEIEVVPDANTASSEGGERYLQLDASEGATTIWEMKDWDNTVTDYAVEARLRLPSGGQMGVMAHSKGLVEDGHLFFLTGGKVGLKDLVNLNGTSISLAASTQKSVSTGTWYTVKLAVQDKTLTGYLNGEQVLSATQTDEHKPDRDAPDYDFTKRFFGAPALRAVKDYSLDVQSIKVTSLDGNTIYCNYDFSTDADANTFTEHFNSLRGSGKCELIDTRTNEKPTAFVIDARVGGVEHMYGLGDHGVVTGSNAMKNSVNVVGTSALNKNDFANNGAVARFISNFSIAPDKGFAQVLFEDGYKRVAIDSTQSLLGVGEAQKLDGLYYFFGTPQEIYADYKAVRTEEGYADAKPDYSMFGVGWEAYGAFGGGSSQKAVTECIQNYLNKGYHLTWGVIGSGFWPGESSASEEFAGRSGTTTSFGMWDTKGRYPNPDELKQFFKDNHMKLLLGLRNHLRLPASYEGQSFENAVWSKELDGEFVNSALENGYFLKNADGKVIAAYPYYPGYNYNGNRTPVGVIDGKNTDATQWFAEQAELWGVDGFKEDAMFQWYPYAMGHDANWNGTMMALANKGKSLIVRNAAYSLPGSVLRINDANYVANPESAGAWHNPDRFIMNCMAYAFSGVSNVYPDIVGGMGGVVSDENFQTFAAREAMFAALCPSMSVGIDVTNFVNKDKSAAALKAVNWHAAYAPYIYDAALKSYETGYPTSFTPLCIAYPQDTNTYELANTSKRMYEWLLGESLLAAPIFGADYQKTNSRDVYLPAGKWIRYDTGEVFESENGQTLEDFTSDYQNLPAFVGGKGVLIGQNFKDGSNEVDSYFVDVFPVAATGTVYDYTFVDGTTKSTIALNVSDWNGNLTVTDTTDNKPVSFTENSNTSIRFAFEVGHNYTVSNDNSIKADKTELQNVIAEADKIDTSSYTPESVTALNNALTAAKAVNENPAATQSEINAAKNALRVAINKLTKAEGREPIRSMDGMYEKIYTDDTGSLNYRMYVPADYDSAKTYPVLIYLNGAGSRGTDNQRQLENLSPLITPLIGDKEHECIILVPQLPETEKWVDVDWTKGCYDESVPESKSAKLLMGLLGELKQEWSVNDKRIYLMGQSFGGYGTWDLITRHPDTFAAAIPMAGAGCIARAGQIKDMPLLVLHGDADEVVPVEGSRQMVKAVEAAGNTNVTYLEYEGNDHYVQRRLFEQPELYLDWLFAQEKGKTATKADVSNCYMPVKAYNMNHLTAEDIAKTFIVTGGQATTGDAGGDRLQLSNAALVLAKDTKDLTDGQLTAHFIRNAATNSAPGLVFRAQDERNFVHIRFTNTGVQYFESVDGKWAISSEKLSDYAPKDGRLTCMKVILNGKHIAVYADNVLLAERDITTEKLQTSGMIGVRTFNAAQVDDLIWAEKKEDTSVPSIRLTAPAERQVIQRNLDTKAADVTITGEVKNAAKVLVRVMDGETVQVDWTEATVDAGVFTKTLNLPQGGWYTVEAKGVDADGAELVSAKVERFGIGMNILCIGQSNMVGMDQNGTATVADDRVSNFMNETWSHLVDPYARGDASPALKNQTAGNSMIPTLANALVSAYNIPVGVIPAALGGANLNTWLIRDEDNLYDRTKLYGNSLYRVRAAGGIELIIMNQGENNVSTNTKQEDYLNGMKRLLANYRKDLKNSSLPLFYCQLGPAKPNMVGANTWDDSKNDVMDGIRAAQLLANDPENGLILAAMEMDLERKDDNLHYTTDSQKAIGARVANAIQWYYDQAADKADYYMGPCITDAQFADASNKVLDVTIKHTSGTDFTPSENITGFVVRDGSEDVAIVSAVRKDAATIRLTLTKEVSANVQLRYCKGLLPDISGIVKDNSAMQLPLNITPGWLSVQSAEHQHQTKKTEAKAPSCTEDGNIEYWFCADCDCYFRDEACTQEITKQDTILTKLGHKMVHHPAVAATTTKKGSCEYWECSRCGKWFWDEVGTKEIVDHSDVEIPKKSSGGTSTRPSVKPIMPAVCVFPFTDVPSDSWYYGSVKMAWEKNLIDGVTKTQFQPDGTLTVAQTIKLAATLYQMEHEGKVMLKNGSANWYDTYVSYAVNNGIIEKDYQNYSMAQMNTAITRAEFVHIFHGAESAYKLINQIADNAIPDVKTGDKFVSEIYEFYRAGILTGSDTKGTFHSASTIKRSEAAAILLRMCETSARKSITLK